MTGTPAHPATRKTRGPARLRKPGATTPVKQPKRQPELSLVDMQRLLHELGAHQLELELQNDELRRTRAELEVSRNRFAELYDFSPVGYFTVTPRGLVREANLTGAEMLGVTRGLLIDKSFTFFIEPGDLATYQAHQKEVVERQARRTCEVRIKPRNGPAFYARLLSAVVENADDKTGLIQTAVIDLTERKKAEDVLRGSHEELEVLAKERTAELEMMNEQLRNLSLYLQNAREEERTTIARDVHDELGQMLTTIKLELARLMKRPPAEYEQIMAQAKNVDDMIEATITCVRRIATDLRPGILDHVGLDSAIEWQAGEFEKRNGIPCTVVLEPRELYLDRSRSTAVFRIFQEALTNITRHAGASKVEAHLKLQAGELLLQVKDDGRGISEHKARDAKAMGLIGMRERARSWGGSFAIQGVPDKGTTVVVRIPTDGKGEATQ